MKRRDVLTAGVAMLSALVSPVVFPHHVCRTAKLGRKICVEHPIQNEQLGFACTFVLANTSNQFLLQNCPNENGQNDPFYHDMKRLISDSQTRLDRWILISKIGYGNAGAYPCRGKNGAVNKVITWDPKFLEDLATKAKLGNPLAVGYAILFHEVAHHLNYDTVSNQKGKDRREQELYADYYAGGAMAAKGFSRVEAFTPFSLAGEGGFTHPPAVERVAAAKQGWDDKMAQGQKFIYSLGWKNFRGNLGFR